MNMNNNGLMKTSRMNTKVETSTRDEGDQEKEHYDQHEQ
jgi:hypothetical protein